MGILVSNVFLPAIVCAALGILYTFVIQPIVFYFFGLQRSNEDHINEKAKPDPQKPVYSQRYMSAPKSKSKNSGVIAAILPIYAFGIFVYFVYTIVKLLNNRRKVNPKKKETYLKDYYRNFRYVPEKGKFQMDSDSSDGDHGNGLRKFRPKYDIGWSPAPEGTDSAPDVYRSVAGLPRDLEYLLKKAEDDNLDETELTRLRTRLEQVESEMTRLLEVVNSSTSLLSQAKLRVGEAEATPAEEKEENSGRSCSDDESCELYSAEEE